MPKNKPGKLPRQKAMGDCLYRSAHVQMDGIDLENRSIPIVLATENPIKTFDIRRMDVVDEILRIDGMDIPKQIPLVDSHNYDSVRNVFGSIRDFVKDGDGRLVARAYFAAHDAAVETFNNYRDGHLQDFSIGLKRESFEYKGNTKIVTRSSVFEGSAAIKGADPGSKALPALRACTNPYQVKEEMMTDLREELLTRGMPETVSVDDQVDWLLQRIQDAPEKTPDEPGKKTNDTFKVDDDLVRMLKTLAPDLVQAASPSPEKKHGDDEDDKKKAADKLLQRSKSDAVERIEAIDKLCRTHEIDEKQKWEWVKSDLTEDSIAREILNRMQLKDTGVPLGSSGTVEFGESDREKFYEAARSGIVTRSLHTTGRNPEGYIARAEAYEKEHFTMWHDQPALTRAKELRDELQKPAPGADAFRYKRLPDIARDFCERTGVRTEGLPDQEVCRKALRMTDFVQRASDGPAFNTTGSFANLMLDAMNKTLRAAYDEAPQTYTQWVRQAPSVSDFKTIHRVIFGEIGDMEEISENAEYKEKTATDSRENYAVTKHGGIFSISFEAVVNDDLNAIQRIQQMQGNAMRRRINKDVYDILINNDTLTADAIALFHATSHGANLDTTTLAEGALDTGFNVMMTQSGLDSGTTLGISPRFLIVPSALSATSLRLVGGNFIPATVGNVPLYASGGPRPLEVVIDAHLDGDSTTAWYLAADNNVVDTVELTFLQGEEAPVLDREDGFTTDTIKYKIRQTYKPKAIDFRGLYQGNT